MITKRDGNRVQCECCGAPASFWIARSDGRCHTHHERNPCAIEGCKCTIARGTNGFTRDHFLCSKHWRPLTDKRDRTLFGKIQRKVKRLIARRVSDVPDSELEAQIQQLWRLEDRVWTRMIVTARKRSSGDIDMDEINKMFGWA